MKHLKHFLLVLTLTLLVGRAAAQSAFTNALDFNGTSQHVTVPGATWFSNQFSVESWVYVRSYASFGRLMDFGNGPGIDVVYCALSAGASGQPTFGGYNGNGNSMGFVTAPAPLPLNTWTHLAFTCDGTTGRIYTNGILAASGPMVGATNAVRTNNFIGRSNWADPYANAIFDDFRIWNTARSQAQIQANLGVPLTGSEPNLRLYYRFDSASGSVATNTATATGTAFNGTLVNSPTWVASTAPITYDWMASVANTYPSPLGLTESTRFEVQVLAGDLWKSSFVNYDVARLNGGGASEQAGRSFSWTTFETTNSTLIRVRRKTGAFGTATIRPTRFGIVPAKISADTIQFRLQAGQKVSVEFDADINPSFYSPTYGIPSVTNILMVFADSVRTGGGTNGVLASDIYTVMPGTYQSNIAVSGASPPTAGKCTLGNAGGKKVVVFGPGVYDIGYWQIPNTIEQIHLAGGAVVFGAIDVIPQGYSPFYDSATIDNVYRDNWWAKTLRSSFKVTGPGILSGEKLPWHLKKDFTYTANDDWWAHVKLLQLAVANITVEDVTLVNSPHWVLSFINDTDQRSQGTMDNFKLLGGWTYNNDGLPNPAGAGSKIKNAFIHANDDSLKIYNSGSSISNCVIWQSANGAAFQFGWFSKSVSGVTISDIDVIHFENWWGDGTENRAVFNYAMGGGSGTKIIENIRFEDVIVEGKVLRLFGLHAPASQVIRNCSFNNLSVGGMGVGYLGSPGANYFDGAITNWAFTNFVFDRTLILTPALAGSLAQFQYANGAGVGFTFAPPPVGYYSVANTNDFGSGSLRDLIASAPTNATITFDPSLSGQTILLTNGQLLLRKNLTIDATALSGGITISANNSSRLFYVTNAATVTLAGLTLANGNQPGQGGGGIQSDSGTTLIVSRCTLINNPGGAILNYGAMQLLQSTLHGNSAFYGGAVHCEGFTTISHCTISVNTGSYGGGVFNKATTLTLSNSIVAGNISLVAGDPNAQTGRDIYSQIAALVYSGPNIVPYIYEQSPTTLAIGPTPVTSAPLLSGLGNYGGPTMTMPSLPGSPAIDGCTSGTTFTTDQRGFPRIGGAFADIGAVEVNWPTNVYVDPAKTWIGFMNVFTNIGGIAGTFQFGNSWGTADLNALFTGPTLTLTPNTSIDRDVPNDPFWWVGGAGGPPAKIMDASFYVQNDALAGGQTVIFSGYCTSNTLVSPYTSVAFIKDFVPDYSSFIQTNVAVVTGQPFSIALTTSAGHHIQYGFETVGPNARLANVAALGKVIINSNAPVVILASVPPVLTNAVMLGNGSFQFNFTSTPGASLTVWGSTNVALPFAQWSNLGAPAESPAGTFQFTDPQATTNAQRFYRVTSP